MKIAIVHWDSKTHNIQNERQMLLLHYIVYELIRKFSLINALTTAILLIIFYIFLKVIFLKIIQNAVFYT